MDDRIQGMRALLTSLVALALTIGGVQAQSVGSPVAAQPAAIDLTEIVLSTVVLVRPTEGSGFGSGTIISPHGYVLTNFHVIADDSGRASPMSFLHVSTSFTAAPEFRYVAEYVTGDAALDLAVLRIVADSTFRQVPSIQRFPYLPIGERSGLRPNQRLVVWGYPGIGGRTITSTEGTVSGFSGEDLASDGDRWIKTDAQVAPGNSGGAAITAEGILVAVPTIITGRRLTEDIAVSQNWLRPADLLRELIADLPGVEYMALGGAATPAAATTTPSPPPVAVQPEAAAVEPVTDDGVVRDAATLVARLRQGGEVVVAAGVYQLTAPLELERNVQIVGAGSRETYIASSAEGFVIRFSGPTGSSISGVTFQHLESLPADVVQVRGGLFAEFDDTRFMGAVYDERLDRGGAGPSVTGATQVNITNGEFMENERAGLAVAGSGRVEVNTTRFARNPGFGIRAQSGTLVVQSSTFARESSELTDVAFAGLELLGNVVATLRDSTFTSHERNAISVHGEARLTARGNTIAGAGGNGISVFGRAQADIADNSVQNTLTGVRIGESARGTLTANTLRANQVGVSVAEDAEATISNNVIEDNALTGIDAWDRATVVASTNTIRGNSELGLAAWDRASVVATANTIQGNGIHGVFVADDAEATLSDNVLEINGEAGLAVTDRATVVATANIVRANGRGESAKNVHAYGQARITLRRNTISESRFGILLGETATGSLEDNTIEHHDAYGIHTVDRASASITGNTIRNAATGLLLEATGTSIVRANRIESNSIGIWIGRLPGRGSGTWRPDGTLDVVNNDVLRNSNAGISVWAPARVEGSTIDGNPSGISVDLDVPGLTTSIRGNDIRSANTAVTGYWYSAQTLDFNCENLIAIASNNRVTGSNEVAGPCARSR